MTYNYLMIVAVWVFALFIILWIIFGDKIKKWINNGLKNIVSGA